MSDPIIRCMVCEVERKATGGTYDAYCIVCFNKLVKEKEALLAENAQLKQKLQEWGGVDNYLLATQLDKAEDEVTKLKQTVAENSAKWTLAVVRVRELEELLTDVQWDISTGNAPLSDTWWNGPAETMNDRIMCALKPTVQQEQAVEEVG